LERLYGLKCTTVPEKCEYKGGYLSYEIYMLSNISMNLKGDVIDDSPLTVALYIKTISETSGILEAPNEIYDEIMDGIERFVKDLKREGHILIWLTAQPNVIEERMRRSGCEKRKLIHENPLNLGLVLAKEKNLLESRWKELVDAVIDTSDKNPEEVAREVMKVARGRGGS